MACTHRPDRQQGSHDLHRCQYFACQTCFKRAVPETSAAVKSQQVRPRRSLMGSLSTHRGSVWHVCVSSVACQAPILPGAAVAPAKAKSWVSDDIESGPKKKKKKDLDDDDVRCHGHGRRPAHWHGSPSQYGSRKGLWRHAVRAQCRE